MPYLNELEKRYEILGLFCWENEPKTILEIARGIGYKSPTPIRNILNAMEDDGTLIRYGEVKPNGVTRWIYEMDEGGEGQRKSIAETLRDKRRKVMG